MKIETAMMFGEEVEVVNVSRSVGYQGAIFFDDVVLIQGLFRYISKVFGLQSLGLSAYHLLPHITGVLNADAADAAIRQFQIVNAGSLIKKHFDGRIDPAHYTHRSINRHGAHYMSITHLHFLATDASAMIGEEGDYIESLAKLDSRLAYAIDMAVMNS